MENEPKSTKEIILKEIKDAVTKNDKPYKELHYDHEGQAVTDRLWPWIHPQKQEQLAPGMGLKIVKQKRGDFWNMVDFEILEDKDAPTPATGEEEGEDVTTPLVAETKGDAVAAAKGDAGVAVRRAALDVAVVCREMKNTTEDIIKSARKFEEYLRNG